MDLIIWRIPTLNSSGKRIVAQAMAVAEFPIGLAPARIPGITELLERALTLVPADSHEAGRLLSRYGGILGIAEGDYEGAQQALRRAIAIAKREGDVQLEVQTLAYTADVSGQHLLWQDSVDNGLRAIELAAGDETAFSEVLSRFWIAVSLLYMGGLNAALPHALLLRDMAEEQYNHLLGQQGTMIFDLSSVDRLLGLMSQTMGNLAKAADHFEDALAFCRTAGYRPELAWTCCDYADMLRERDGEGDHAKAVSLQDEALAISSELGMRPLMERVLSRREILKA